jgi:hypothetical protein
MSPGEVLDKHSSRELSEWAAYLQIEPQGEERADLRAGIVASTIANANRKKGTKAFKPSDFMPKFDKEEQTQTPEQQKAAAEALALAFGGKKGKLSKISDGGA